MDMKKSNMKIRVALTTAGMRQWQFADLLGVHQSVLARWMRYELPEDLQNEAVALIRGDSVSGDLGAKIRYFVNDTRRSMRSWASEPQEKTLNRKVSKTIREVEELELRREQERQGWL